MLSRIPLHSVKGSECVLPSYAYHPIFPSGSAAMEMFEPAAHPHAHLCRIAAFQHVFNSGFKQLFLFGLGNIFRSFKTLHSDSH